MARETLGHLVDRLKLKPGTVGSDHSSIKPTPPTETRGDIDGIYKPDAPEAKTDVVGIYTPEPTNDKKLYGANIDVLHTLETIDFFSGDGALQQNIAYIKFWGDTTLGANVVDPEIFGSIKIDSELRKCFELKSTSECKYSIANDIKLPTFSLEASTQTPNEEVGKSVTETLQTLPTNYISELRFTDGINENAKYEIATGVDPFKQYEGDIQKYLNSLPTELQSLLPEAPKPPTLLESTESGVASLQTYRDQATAWLEKANEYTNKIPDQLSEVKVAIQQVSATIEGFFGSLDKHFRTASNVLKTTGQVLDTWDKIQGFFDRDLDIPVGSSLLDELGVSTPQLDIPLDTPQDILSLDIPLNESILSADVSSKVEKISTYSCKEVLSKKEGIWQFLFNPSQLVYNYNSDYATSDVWATPDGKPLHWKGNNNVELQFSEVVLNGYMFGRKVEYLAQGLKDLMGFGGSTYMGSPPVLEFVWGSKRFGPCMMKDLSVTESMWDGGELVSATCSFTLVKVPEWIVNDGYVDIFDPSRTPVFIPRVPDDLLNEDVGETTGDEVIGQAGDEAKDDPKVDLDINKPPVSKPTNTSSRFCSIYLKLEKSIVLAINSYLQIEKFLNAINVRGDKAISLYLNNSKEYQAWIKSVNEINSYASEIFSTIDANRRLVDLFLNNQSNRECDFRNIQGLYDIQDSMQWIDANNLIKVKQLSKSMIIKSVKCRNKLNQYIYGYIKSKCYSQKGEDPQKRESDNIVICKMTKNSLESIKYIRASLPVGSNATPLIDTLLSILPITAWAVVPARVILRLLQDKSITEIKHAGWINPPKPGSVAPKSISQLFLDTSIFQKNFETLLKSRSDLKKNYEEFLRLKNYNIKKDLKLNFDFKGNTCENLFIFYMRIFSISSEWDNFSSLNSNMRVWDFYQNLGIFYNKCLNPMSKFATNLRKTLKC